MYIEKDIIFITLFLRFVSQPWNNLTHKVRFFFLVSLRCISSCLRRPELYTAFKVGTIQTSVKYKMKISASHIHLWRGGREEEARAKGRIVKKREEIEAYRVKAERKIWRIMR